MHAQSHLLCFVHWLSSIGHWVRLLVRRCLRLIDLVIVGLISLEHAVGLLRIVINARLDTLEFFHFPFGFLILILLAHPLHFLLIFVLLLPDGDLVFLGKVLAIL